MTTPDANASNTTLRSKPLAWVAAAVVAIAVVLNLAIMSRGGHVAGHAWALLIGLAIALPAYFTTNRGTQRLFVWAALIAVIAAFVGILTKAF